VHTYSFLVRIATWNINSINRRLDRVIDWLAAVQPDVLCLQETKCRADDFPALMFSGVGYESAVVGDGAWNGVAILSRVGVADVSEGLPAVPSWEGKSEPRALGAVCGDLRLWSLYVPNGRTLDHDHYRYKLEWLDCLTQTAIAELGSYSNLALLGDFNIAPTDDDVWDIELFSDSTHVTAAERQRLADLRAAGVDREARKGKGASDHAPVVVDLADQ